MTEGEQIAFNNGFILGRASKGILKGETIIKPYYNEPTINGGIVMADRPLVGNDAEIQNMIFNAKANVYAQYRPYMFIAYGKWDTFLFPKGPQWVVFFSYSNTATFDASAPNYMDINRNQNSVVAPFKSNWTVGDGYNECDVFDASRNKLPYIAYSTINIIDSATSEIIMPAPYNLFG